MKLYATTSFVSLVLALAVFIAFPNGNAQIDLLHQVRDLISKENWFEAQKILKKAQRNEIPKEDLHLFDFHSALVELRLKNFGRARDLFVEYSKNHSKLTDFASFYQAKAMIFLGEKNEAEAHLKSLEKSVSNVKLRTEILKELGQFSLSKNDFSSAQKQFTEVLRRIRLSEDAPETHYMLAQAERGLKNSKRFCSQIMKIYSEYPQFDKIKSWGPHLSDNVFEGEKTGCLADFDDFRRRIRFFMWAGMDQRALAEINLAKEKSLFVPVEVDQALAYYFVQSGEVSKALEVLKKYEDQLGDKIGYIVNYAGILARAGELSKSIEYYQKAHELDPKDTSGRQALYQSAFLSYQNRNYADAEKRFKEFLKKYPRSGLTQDAKWHLAWIKYLKKDYLQAIEDFKNLETKTVKRRGKRSGKKIVIKQDRVKYWLAMSYLRLNKMEQAKQIFENLGRDSLFGYYSIAALSRIKFIEAQVKESAARKLANQTTRIHRFNMRDFLLPSLDSREEILTSENEDQIRFEADMDFSKTGSDPEISNLVIQEENESDIEAIEPEEPEIQIKDPKILARMESARDLMILGLKELAKWDLYDVERITKNREYLKVLMSDYAILNQYHRSSYIAQTYFGSLRQKLGMTAGKNFWEQAYPKAYEEHVVKYSRRHGVSQELIWGIMKAESQFRMDAISPVGALGLMQVMPFTGMRVATLMKEPQFKPSDLLVAESSVKYGSRYLRRLSDKFKGLTPLVAAAYNAGPHRVKAWTYSFGDLNTDEFIEHIPFLETRNYVKKVLSYHYIYSQLYKGSSDFVDYLASSIPYQVDGRPPFRESWEDI